MAVLSANVTDVLLAKEGRSAV